MSMLTWLHIAGGSLAILSGAVAVAAPKGRPLHARAGTWFFVSMLVLGITAAILAWLNGDGGLGMGRILTCYFVASPKLPRAAGPERPAGSRALPARPRSLWPRRSPGWV